MKRKTFQQLILNILLAVMCIAIIIPFILLISISISNEQDILQNGYKLIPEHIDFSAYKYMFTNSDLLVDAYGVTIFTSIVGTLLAVLMMSMIAYPLSQTTMKGRNGLAFFLYFSGMFGGGMVPTYLLMTKFLHLQNTLWIYIVSGLMAPFYVFMIRTYMQSINGEILEAAFIDGANDYRIFVEFAIPLSAPVLATVALFTFLGKWGDWMNSMLYIDDPKLYTVQYLLQKILRDVELINSTTTSQVTLTAVPTESVRMAMAVAIALPALMIFPIFQKYFVKGMVVGSVKG